LQQLSEIKKKLLKEVFFMLKKKQNRLQSLDAFRGLVIVCMLLVNSLPNFDEAYPILLHSHWEGITLADLAFPGFIFAMGTAGAFFFPKHGHESSREIFGLLLRRGLLLIVLGLCLNQVPLILHHFLSPDGNGTNLLAQIWEQGRIPGVLQRLGLVYFCGLLLTWQLKRDSSLYAAAAVLLLLASAGFHLYAPQSPFSPDHNISMAMDEIFPGSAHCYLGKEFDPEGLYGTMSATASMLFGILAGRHLTAAGAAHAHRLRLLSLSGTILLVAGLLWSQVDIVCKSLWTAPYALLTSGLFMWLLCLLELLFSYRTDFAQHLFAPCQWFGKNALLFYILPEVALMSLWTLKSPAGNELYAWLWSVTVMGIWDTPFSILLFSLLWIAMWLPLARYLHRHNIILRA
jgi:predicted acyltransferase